LDIALLLNIFPSEVDLFFSIRNNQTVYIKSIKIKIMKKLIFTIAILGFATQGFSQNAAKGKGVYDKVCVACHQPTGQGVPGAFPPLAKSDYLNADVNRAIKGVVKGLSGPITVNGKKFNSAMPAQALSDQQIADALTYVYASWGNSKKVITPAMVKAQRK
jgi:mono/diheme cytochrome c family protein